MRLYQHVIHKARELIDENERLKAKLAQQEAEFSGMFPETWLQVPLCSLKKMEALGLIQLADY
jgi:hypothetical protein